MSSTLRVAELETLFTANLGPFTKGAKQVDQTRDAMRKGTTTLAVEANTTGALADLKSVENEAKAAGNLDPEVVASADVKGALTGLDRVEASAKRLVSKETALEVNADVAAAQSKITAVSKELGILARMQATPQVTADIAKAQSELSDARSRLSALDGLRAEMVVDVSADGAKAELKDVADYAGEAGEDAGESAGAGISGKIVAAIATIPVAGAIVGIGVALGQALGDAITDGLDVEVREDEVAARTGLDEATVRRLGRAAGEAYADNFGESIRDNLSTAQNAIQTGLLDAGATKQASQNMIESLSGVSSIIGEEIPRVTRSTMQLLRTGLASTADEAFDVIVKGQQAGLNVSEDWLDTIDEYSTQWRKLGLDGGQTLGLLSQAVRAGARDTDTAADALKEFSIRAIDGSETTKAGFEAIGLSAETMAARIAAGGPDAAAALDETLDRLRAIEDPAQRAQAAVGLFGTKAEDLGDALYAMDLTTAAQEIGDYAGAAQSAIATMSDNTAADIETAKRNIELASDGIKGALAQAFGPQLEQWADYVVENRGPVMEFLSAVANGAIDLGVGFVDGMAAATEGIGSFIGGPAADLIDTVADMVDTLRVLSPLLNLTLPDSGEFHDLADGMRDFEGSTAAAADTMRTDLIENGLEPARDRMNGFFDPLIDDAYVHDALTRTSSALDAVGLAADGTEISLEDLAVSGDGLTTANLTLRDQLSKVSTGLAEQLAAAQAAGEGQEDLQARYNQTRDALIAQLQQMGLTQDQATRLADTYLSIPGSVNTDVTAETATAEQAVAAFTEKQRHIVVQVGVKSDGSAVYSSDPGNRSVMRFERDGDVLQFLAAGALRPMSGASAQIVPPNTWRVIGDRPRGDELFAPLDGSARSHTLMAEGARRMGAAYIPLADGAVLAAATGTAAPAGLTRADLAWLAEQIAATVLTGARDVSAQTLATAARAAAGSRSTAGVVR
jgi:hypothetical protein